MLKMKIKSFVKKTIRLVRVIETRLFWGRKMLLGRNTIMVGCKLLGKCYGKIQIGNNCELCNVRFHISKVPGNRIIIGDGVKLIDTEFILRNGGNNTIIIGDFVTTGGRVQFAACEGKTITVGEDCQFAHNIQVWTNDHHPIYDVDGKRVNPAKDVVIGNRVWIGTNVMILKGTYIGNGNVIGAGSVVTNRAVACNSIYVGSPLKKVKENIRWERNFNL